MTKQAFFQPEMVAMIICVSENGPGNANHTAALGRLIVVLEGIAHCVKNGG